MKDNISGVYGIYNIISRKWYVGSSVKCVKTRLSAHRFMLLKGSHHSKHLQNAWNKYGESNFKMKVIEECESIDCIDREQHWMDKRRSSDHRYGYNIHPNARNPLGVKRSEETKKKLSIIASNRSPELLARIKYATTTPEALAKISRAHKGKVLSAETRKKISESVLKAVPFYRERAIANRRGIPVSEDRKKHLSKVLTGRIASEEQRKNQSLYASNRPKSHQDKIREGIKKTSDIKSQRKILDTLLEMLFIPAPKRK